jgi:hypothetical protein
MYKSFANSSYLLFMVGAESINISSIKSSTNELSLLNKTLASNYPVYLRYWINTLSISFSLIAVFNKSVNVLAPY